MKPLIIRRRPFNRWLAKIQFILWRLRLLVWTDLEGPSA